MLSVFAFFVCGNTLCLHSHTIGDYTIVHSHPYLPSSQHTHSQQSLNTIAALNASPLLTVISSAEPTAPVLNVVALLTSKERTFVNQYLSELNLLRAPPACYMITIEVNI